MQVEAVECGGLGIGIEPFMVRRRPYTRQQTLTYVRSAPEFALRNARLSLLECIEAKP